MAVAMVVIVFLVVVVAVASAVLRVRAILFVVFVAAAGVVFNFIVVVFVFLLRTCRGTFACFKMQQCRLDQMGCNFFFSGFNNVCLRRRAFSPLRKHS